MVEQCVDVPLAGVKECYLSPPRDIHMRIPDKLIKCVGFISHDLPTLKYLGTVFIAGVRSKDHEGGYLHLVTAKHVAEEFDPGSFVIAINGKDGKPLYLKSGEDSRWWYHPTEKSSVDVAVTVFGTARFHEYDVEWIPEDMFATDDRIKEYGIGLGDETFVVGLFTKFFGTSKLTPIVRTGNISMMPTDKIPLKDFGDVEAYLAEGRSIGGLSGSPVFVRNTVNLPTLGGKGRSGALSGLGPMHLLGLVHGHWDLPVTFNESEKKEAVNMGVSIVIPAKKILEVLHHPELVEMRKQQDEEAKKAPYPSADIDDTEKRRLPVLTLRKS